jgi:hypothetical protein
MAEAGGGAPGQGRERLVARSKAALASAQLVRLSSGSHVSPNALRSTQRTRTQGRPYRILNRRISCTLCSGLPSAPGTGGGGPT